MKNNKDDNRRIYDENINISKNNVTDFWNKRAKKYSDNNPYGVVKLNDNNEEFVKMLDEYEKVNLIPKLDIDENSRVLDIGCGIGRLSEIIIPKVQYYLGMDIAKDLIALAKSRVKLDKEYDFCVSDFCNMNNLDIVKSRAPFNKVIIAGVLLFINDEELVDGFNRLLPLLDKKCTIYITGSVGVEKRLTLNEFYSETLDSEYSVIFRT